MIITDLSYADAINSHDISMLNLQGGGRAKPYAFANSVAAGDASGGNYAAVFTATNASAQTSPFGATAFSTASSTAIAKG